jgi:hypothetical protein
VPNALGHRCQFAPEYEGAELRRVNDVEFKRLGITRKWREHEVIGNRRVAVEDGVLLVSPRDEAGPLRQITSVGGRKLRRLGGTNSIALTAVENSQEEKRSQPLVLISRIGISFPTDRGQLAGHPIRHALY